MCYSFLLHLIPSEPSLPSIWAAIQSYGIANASYQSGRQIWSTRRPFCLILLGHGADERISYVRESHSITNLSLYLIYQEKWQRVIEWKQSIGLEKNRKAQACFHWYQDASVAFVPSTGFHNLTDVTHDFVLKCNTCALSPDMSFYYCWRDELYRNRNIALGQPWLKIPTFAFLMRSTLSEHCYK